MGSVEVHILGQKYVIKGDASAEHIRHLANFLDEKIKEVYDNFPNTTPLRASILAALNIADELHNVKKEYSSVSKSIKSIEDKADSIIKLFD
jgi:cell division protein ZapA